MGEMPTPVGSGYVMAKEKKIVVDHELGIGEYFIKDELGALLFDVKGPTFVGRDVWRVLANASGNDLILLKNKGTSWHDKWYAYRYPAAGQTEGTLLFTMSKPNIFQIIPAYEIFLPTNDTPAPDFTVKGNFWERNYKVFFRGARDPIAEARKRFSMVFPVAIGKDRYVVTVYPGVDQAFIAAVVVIINEVKEDKRREIRMHG